MGNIIAGKIAGSSNCSLREIDNTTTSEKKGQEDENGRQNNKQKTKT
jgi:hypothetical protein